MQVAIMFIFLTMLSNDQVITIPEVELNDGSYVEKVKPSNKKNISIILEVEGNPNKHRKYIEDYYPSIEVVATYTTLFQGIALKGPANKLEKLLNAQFIRGAYPVQTYTALETSPLNNVNELDSFVKDPNTIIPNELNNTNYTGKGVKIAVIDTGVDFTHPDLKGNYAGGFDLVDLDDDPMETTIDQGVPTMHGTHVAGIIAAKGDIKGVAPDGEIYAYRALGPGGVGTSIQVIAAMEEAVEAGVDIMNLSLGNIVNGPDYPTSKAVNEASKQGVAVVVANGNDGPGNWSVGAPATAASALSVGAYQDNGELPFLYEGKNRKKITLSPLRASPSWKLVKDYEITTNTKDVMGKIGMIKQDDKSLVEKIINLQDAGAVGLLIHYTNPKNTEWLAGLEEVDIKIPVALISKKDGNWIAGFIEEEVLYFKNEIQKTNETVANFSSRGPVTLNWMLKPDVIAPGVNILSTVPGGYDMLNGTSMAAPHVAGALAVIKEAHPSWTNEKIFGALKTTGEEMQVKTGELVEPIIQGAGLINIKSAMNTRTIIYDPLLSFGNITKHVVDRKINLSIENISNDRQEFHFDIPKKNKGFSWNLPKSFSIEAKEIKEVPVELKINSLQLKKGIHQGHLLLNSNSDSYYLPYVFINETADYPKVMGFSIQLDKLNKKVYEYQLYVAEAVKSVQIQLFDPKSLIYEGELIKLKELDIGMNKGEIKKSDIKKSGLFYGLIIVQLENGDFVNYETEVLIE